MPPCWVSAAHRCWRKAVFSRIDSTSFASNLGPAVFDGVAAAIEVFARFAASSERIENGRVASLHLATSIVSASTSCAGEARRAAELLRLRNKPEPRRIKKGACMAIDMGLHPLVD